MPTGQGFVDSPIGQLHNRTVGSNGLTVVHLRQTASSSRIHAEQASIEEIAPRCDALHTCLSGHHDRSNRRSASEDSEG